MKQKKKEKKFLNIRLKKKRVFQLPPKDKQFLPKFQKLVLWLVGLIDAKDINVTQPMWPSCCQT